VFHFNKKHIEDQTVPMWVIKSHGVTFYVNHVTAEIPWNTKETSDNPSTKGSIKFKKCKLTIDDDNCATLSKLGLLDKGLPHPRLIFRIIAGYNDNMHKALKDNEFKHTKFKEVAGGCGSSFVVCDLLDEQELTFASIKYAQTFRILSPNEAYYKAYDENGEWINESDDWDDDGDEDE
jgi:hypothetical protein